MAFACPRCGGEYSQLDGGGALRIPVSSSLRVACQPLVFGFAAVVGLVMGLVAVDAVLEDPASCYQCLRPIGTQEWWALLWVGAMASSLLGWGGRGLWVVVRRERRLAMDSTLRREARRYRFGVAVMLLMAAGAFISLAPSAYEFGGDSAWFLLPLGLAFAAMLLGLSRAAERDAANIESSSD